MNILVIIPILNPSEDFFNTIIPALTRQTIQNKILLINSGNPIKGSESYEVITIDKKEFNHANTRNLALKHDSDFYLFMTQDATPFDSCLIENLLKPFIDENVVVSYARQIPYENAHITESFARETNYPAKSIIKSKQDIKTLGIKTYFSSDSCAIYRGSYFQEKQGFKKDLNASEDMAFAAMAILDNKKIAYESEAKVYHSHVYTIKSLFKRYLTIGKFFKENSWIEESLKEAKKTENTGFKQALAEFKHILKKQPLAIVKSFVYTCIKYLGYKLGKNLD